MLFFSMQNLLLDLQWLKDIGERPFQSEASQMVAIGIEKKMKHAGWRLETINLKGNLIGCKGKGHTLLLAHHDTVPNSIGIIDNGVAVASLLEFARSTTAEDVCIGFPTGEEIGLVGSTQMVSYIHKWHPNPEELRLVVSLELVGHGTLWASGLSKTWNYEQLQWLNTTPHLQYEYAYQIVSRIAPEMERSDHKPFSSLSIPTMMILGRNESGVFPNYHSSNDTTFEEASIPPLLEALEYIANNPIPESPKNTTSALMLWGLSIPSPILWVVNVLALAAGFSQKKRLKESLQTLLLGIIPLLCGFLLNWSMVSLSFFSVTPEEITAHNTMGIPPTGWWNAAICTPCIGIVCYFAFRYTVQPKGSSSLLCALFSIPLLLFDPFLALPMSIAAILSLFWYPLSLIGVLYWIQPSILRELTFHGILPAVFWPIFFVLLIPVLGHTYARD